MSKVLLVKISPQELRAIFNASKGGYPNKITTLRSIRTYDELANPKSGQEPGTRSIVEKFYDENTLVIVVHYFLKPDNTLGGSGMLDPTKLRVGNVLYWAP